MDCYIFFTIIKTYNFEAEFQGKSFFIKINTFFLMTVCICCKCIDKTKKKQIIKGNSGVLTVFLHKTFCNDIPNVTLLKIMYARIREKV